MRRILGDTGQMLRFNWKNLMLFHVGYRLAAAAVYVQLLGFSMEFSLRRAGYSYLTLENAARYFLSPWTLPLLALLAAVGLVLLMVEAGGLTAAFSSSIYSLKMTPLEILTQGIRSSAQQIERKNFGLFAVVAADFFVLNLVCIYRTLTHVKPVNFVIRELSGRPFLYPAVIFFTFLCIAAVIPVYYVFHECMIEQKCYRDGKIRSRELLKGRYVQTVMRVVCPQIFLIGAAAAVYGALVVVMAVFAVVFVQRDLQTAFLLRAADWGEWVVMAGVSLISAPVYFAGLTVQYYRYGHNQIGREQFFAVRSGGLSRRHGLLILAFAGLAGGLGLLDGALNGSFLASSLAVQTEITAHRGSSKTAPENTLAALEAAVEEMADWAEIDVQETLDGVVVVCHDWDLKRVCGVDRRVSQLTWEELKNLDAGTWFSVEYAGEGIPCLRDAMEYAKGKIKLNIEMKYSGADSELPEKVQRLVEEYEMEEQCILTSTSLDYLKRVKEKNPQIRTGHIVPAAYGNYDMDEWVDVISIRSGFVSESFIRRAHENGKTVHSWTVNDKKELERMRVLGVDNVITDVPLLAREILYREEAAESLLEYLRMMFS